MSEPTSCISAEYGIRGTAVRDAESAFEGKGLTVRIAVNHGYMKDGSWVDTGTTYLDYSATNEYAGELAEVEKGDKVEISGSWSLQTREYQYENKKTGLVEKGFGVSARYGTLEIVERASDRAASKVSADTPF